MTSHQAVWSRLVCNNPYEQCWQRAPQSTAYCSTPMFPLVVAGHKVGILASHAILYVPNIASLH